MNDTRIQSVHGEARRRRPRGRRGGRTRQDDGGNETGQHTRRGHVEGGGVVVRGRRPSSPGEHLGVRVHDERAVLQRFLPGACPGAVTTPARRSTAVADTTTARPSWVKPEPAPLSLLRLEPDPRRRYPARSLGCGVTRAGPSTDSRPCTWTDQNRRSHPGVFRRSAANRSTPSSHSR